MIFSRSSIRGALHVLAAITLAAGLQEDLLAFKDGTHSSISVVAARDHAESKVARFLITELGIVVGLDLTAMDDSGVIRSYLEWIRQGSFLEDETLTWDGSFRYNNHFYNPYNKEGLNDTTVINPIGGFAEPALNWAWNNRNASWNEDFSWLGARRAYFTWMTATTLQERDRAAARLFRSLGQVIHLLQDMAVPQHTRNDAHLPGYLGGHGAPFEEYCENNLGTEAAVGALPRDTTPVFTVKPNVDLCPIVCPDFQAFWDTDQLARRAGFVSSSAELFVGTPGLAEFSNAYFVTDDTMFTGEPGGQVLVLGPSGRSYWIKAYPAPVCHRFPFPKLRELLDLPAALPDEDIYNPDNHVDLRYYVILRRAGEKAPDPYTVEEWFTGGIDSARAAPLVPAFCAVQHRMSLDLHELWVGLRQANHTAYAQALIPKAVAYSTGLLNFFFRGKIEATFLPGFGEDGNDAIEITNLSEEPLGEGEFRLLGDSETGNNRNTLAIIGSAAGYPGRLEPRQSFRASVGAVSFARPLWLVFKGTLGTEEGEAVVGKRLCLTASAGEERAKYRAIDLGTFTGIFENDISNWGLNNQGRVLGLHAGLTGKAPELFGGGGYVWLDQNQDQLAQAGEFEFVGTGQGWGTRVMDINDHGVVAGTAFDAEGKQYLARWEPAGEMGGYSAADVSEEVALGGIAINNRGTILDPLRAKVWFKDEAVLDLKTLFEQEVDTNKFQFQAASDLNDSDELLVRAIRDPGTTRAQNTFLSWCQGGFPTDSQVEPSGIGQMNNHGQAVLMTFKTTLVGTVEMKLPNLIIYDFHTGERLDLNIMLANWDLCDCGIVVGSKTVGSSSVAKIWDRENGLRDLANVTKVPAGVTLTHGLRVNNCGQILAAGLVGGVRHAYLLVRGAK